MTVGLLALRNSNDDEDGNNSITWLSLTNNEIGISIPDLTESLQKSGPRRSLRKVSCHAGFLGSLYNSDLRLLIETIAKLHNLQDLWLALSPKQSHLSKDIIQTILLLNNNDGDPSSSCRQSLKKLTIRGIDDAGCAMLAKSLRRRRRRRKENENDGVCRITELQIRGSVSANTNNANATAAQLNSKVSRRGIMAIAHMLQVNQSLERVALCYKGLDMGCCRAFAKALEVNQTIQRLEITNPPPTKSNNNNQSNSVDSVLLAEGYDLLVRTMKTNYTLQHLTVPPLETANNKGAVAGGGDHKSLFDLFTKLNRAGGRAILHNSSGRTTLADVLDLLQDNNNINNLSVLYEILSEMPALWDPFKTTAVAPVAANGLLLLRKHNTKKTQEKPLATTKKATSCLSEDETCASATAKTANNNNNNRVANIKPHHQPPPQPQLPSFFSNSTPAMSRWSQRIFANLEQEKIQPVLRPSIPTTTVMENDASSRGGGGAVVEANQQNKTNKTNKGSSRRKTSPPGYDMYYAPCMGLNQPMDPFLAGQGGQRPLTQRPTLKKRSATTGSPTTPFVVRPPRAAAAGAAAAASAEVVAEEKEEQDKNNGISTEAAARVQSDVGPVDTADSKKIVKLGLSNEVKEAKPAAAAATPAAKALSSSLGLVKTEPLEDVLAAPDDSKKATTAAGAPSCSTVHSICRVSPRTQGTDEQEPLAVIGRTQNAAEFITDTPPAKKTAKEEQRVVGMSQSAGDTPKLSKPATANKAKEKEANVGMAQTGLHIPPAVRPLPSAIVRSSPMVSAKKEVVAEATDEAQLVVGMTQNAAKTRSAVQQASVSAFYKALKEEQTSSPTAEESVESKKTKQAVGSTQNVPYVVPPLVQPALLAALQRVSIAEPLSMNKVLEKEESRKVVGTTQKTAELTAERASAVGLQKESMKGETSSFVEDDETNILRQRLDRKKKQGLLHSARPASTPQLRGSPATASGSLPRKSHQGSSPGRSSFAAAAAAATVESSADIAKEILDIASRLQKVSAPDSALPTTNEQKPSGSISSPAKGGLMITQQECAPMAPTTSTSEGSGASQQGITLTSTQEKKSEVPLLRAWSSKDLQSPPKNDDGKQPAMLREWKPCDRVEEENTSSLTAMKEMTQETIPSSPSLLTSAAAATPEPPASPLSASRRPRKRISVAAKKMWKGTKTLLHGFKAR